MVLVVSGSKFKGSGIYISTRALYHKGEQKPDRINTNIDNDDEEEASPPIFSQGLKNIWVLVYISFPDRII